MFGSWVFDMFGKLFSKLSKQQYGLMLMMALQAISVEPFHQVSAYSEHHQILNVTPFYSIRNYINSPLSSIQWSGSTRKGDSTSTTPPFTSATTGPISSTSESKKSQFEVLSFCNDPGRPYHSSISPVQLTYSENEQVMYTCDDFISLKQYKKCVKGQWQGDMPICGEAFRNNDLVYARIYESRNGLPEKLLADYNVTNRLSKFVKFSNSFISERLEHPIRAANSTNYYWLLYLAKPALVQLVRISFAVVNHLTDHRLMRNRFRIEKVSTNSYRDCRQITNNSVSPWEFNSTRFDFWFFCRSKSKQDFNYEINRLTNVIQVVTSSQIPIKYDLSTLILAEQYSNNDNYSDPICGLPEVPVGLETRVVNDQTNYAFTCGKDFRREDLYGGQFQVRTCGFDMHWHGQLPLCVPIKSCPKFDLNRATFLVEVYKYDKVYFINQTDWISIKGTRAFFRCKDETNIFVGADTRVCDEEGEWSSSMPNCLVANKPEPDSLRTTSILIIVLTTLIFTFVLSSCTIYCFLKMPNSQTSTPSSGIEMSDSANLYYSTPGKQIDDEVYETVNTIEARYTSYRDPVQNKNCSNPFVYDYSDASSNPIVTNDFPTGPLQYNEDPYYDDTNVRPVYKDSYEVMHKTFM